MINAVVLKKNGNISDIEIKITKKDRNNDVKTYFKKFKKYINKKSKYNVELIDIWNIKEHNLIGYGISKGEINLLNKHELLSTTNNNKYYGDILLIKTNKNNTIENLTSTEYEVFYNKFYGYYESEEEDNEYDDSDNSLIDDLESDISDSPSYDEMYDSEEVKLSDYESDESHYEITKTIKKKIISSKLKQSFTKELEYESYSSESD